jgi:hypothetical protein
MNKSTRHILKTHIYYLIMTTIVSGFLSILNGNRSFDKYLELGIKLLNLDVPKIIFADKLMHDKIKTYENEYTRLILYNETESYLYSYINDTCLLNFDINTTNPLKDTPEYMFVQCNKTEWIKLAIEINHFNTTQFVWVDFGIRHLITTDDNFYKYILNLKNNSYTNVRIASIWDVNNFYNINIYKNIVWYFAGSVFGGDKDALLIFAEKMKTHCMQIITEHQTLMWEVNIWYLIFKENQELFDCYQCDHNDSIITNY